MGVCAIVVAGAAAHLELSFPRAVRVVRWKRSVSASLMVTVTGSGIAVGLVAFVNVAPDEEMAVRW